MEPTPLLASTTPTLNVSEKGSGKDTAMKTLAGQVLDRGGRIIAVDRTPMGEWEVWAKAVTDTAVVDVPDPRYSLDPLRLFGSQHLSNPDDSSRAAAAGHPDASDSATNRGRPRCRWRLWGEADGAQCVLDHGHKERGLGHEFADSHGSYVDDRRRRDGGHG